MNGEARPIWRETAEVIGVPDVIGSLTFVAPEIRESSEALGFQARLERESVIRQGLRARIDPSELVRATAKAINEETLNDEDVILLDDIDRAVPTDFWFAYDQARDGVIELDTLPGGLWRNIFHQAYPRMDLSWGEFQLTLPRGTEFVEWVEELLDCESLTDMEVYKNGRDAVASQSCDSA